MVGIYAFGLWIISEPFLTSTALKRLSTLSHRLSVEIKCEASRRSQFFSISLSSEISLIY